MIFLLTLDITRVYDRIIRRQLIHMLRMKRISENMINWVHSFMIDKITTLVIGNYEIKKALINAGIP